MIRAFLLLATLATLAAPANAQEVVIGTSSTYPPMIIHTGRAPVTGLEGDLLAELCTRAGWTCRWEFMPFDVIFPALEAGRIDIAANALGYSEERAARVHMTCPYRPLSPGGMHGTFFTRDPSHDPRSGPIAVLRGTLHHAALAEAGLDLRLFSEDDAAMDAVVSGALQAYFGPTPAVENYPNRAALIPAGEMPIRSGGTSIAVSPERPDLAAALDAQLIDLSHDGIITAITRQWLSDAVDDPIALCDTGPPLS
ncbi:transporter substrate-binding domain-containing protein [Rhodobacteraceae bacterium N5(2021)]|uniref:Transporter substrate-binding domain-containing protein n=1 Tax=Gymnodinialimonas phycosphaerae TaxID=2841589 RepID=A0A975YFU1_9RHOB|nr:transporter substrate-binding domain-containing protein [Gymnodinialimonas phycosphaerae]MBY4895171.1 transporter substrate-binding domain-containing protein [Gymnodinialimonas phycosphaerae]